MELERSLHVESVDLVFRVNSAINSITLSVNFSKYLDFRVFFFSLKVVDVVIFLLALNRVSLMNIVSLLSL